MRDKRIAGWVALAVFLLTIPAANWTLDTFGFLDVPGLGPVASGVAWIGLAFVMRDIAQLLIGKWWTLVAIVGGIGLSYILADPFIATASAVAFGVSETMDFAIYTPLARRRFVLAVLASSCVGALLDSYLFLIVAFDSSRGWWQLAVAKSVIVLAVTPLAWGVRRTLAPAA